MGRDTGNLKNKQVEKLIRAGQRGAHYDGRGLRLEIKGPNSAHWVIRHQIEGITRYMGLGSAFDFTLGQARDRNSRLVRQKLADGIDPVIDRRSERAAKALTFADAARRFLEQHNAKWDNAKHRAQWQNTLESYAAPILGRLPVAEIDVPLVLKVLEQPIEAERGYLAGPLWMARPETANRLRGRIESVLDWAKARSRGLGDHRQGAAHPWWAKHHPALPYRDMPTFMTELRAQAGVAARALEFLVYTASRSQEVLKAHWSEFDLACGVWTVPAQRMKMRKEHRVPLAPVVVELLRGLYTESNNDFVFLGTQTGKPLGHTTLSALLKRMGHEVTVHGMRSAFRDWAGESTAFPHDVCEAALAHVKGKTERAYQRGDLFDRRRTLMTAWAKFCALPSTKAGCDVVTLGATR